MAIRAVTNPRRKTYRCAVVVSKKISKSAVVRNRIRRRIYEQIRLHNQLVPAGTDLVVTIYSDQVAIIEQQALQQVVFDLLQQTAKNLDQ